MRIFFLSAFLSILASIASAEPIDEYKIFDLLDGRVEIFSDSTWGYTSEKLQWGSAESVYVYNDLSYIGWSSTTTPDPLNISVRLNGFNPGDEVHLTFWSYLFEAPQGGSGTHQGYSALLEGDLKLTVSAEASSCVILTTQSFCTFKPAPGEVGVSLTLSNYQYGVFTAFAGCDDFSCGTETLYDYGKLAVEVTASVVAVPEPQTYALMLAGLAVLLAQGILRRRWIAAGTILALGVASTATHAETTQPSGAASSLMRLSYLVEDLDYSDGVAASASPYSDDTAFSTTGSPTTVLRSVTHDGTGYFWKYASPTYTDEFFVPKQDADDTYPPNFFFTPGIEQFIVAPNTHISVSIAFEQSLNYNCTPCMGATYYAADFEGVYQVTDYWGTYVIGERLQSFGTSALKGLWEPGTTLSKSYTFDWYNFDSAPVLVSLYVGSAAMLYVPSTATVTSVPEPQTYALMLTGLAVIGVTMKRRRTGS